MDDPPEPPVPDNGPSDLPESNLDIPDYPMLNFVNSQIHEATSAIQWHGIAINGVDPLFATNLDRSIINCVLNHSICPEEWMVWCLP